ncbi:MAG: hypothetical protein IKN59_00095 [Paludibacteraceae bacterium]|nr:hypothetical protein [Paludibacteraceae bacterium]
MNTRRFLHTYRLIIVLAAVLTACTNKPTGIQNADLQSAVDSLWTNPQHSLESMEKLFVGELTEQEEHIFTITRAHAVLKLHHSLEDEDELNAAAEYCLSRKMNRYAGEAYYIQGAYRNYVGENATAMMWLKQAERTFEGAEVPPILTGMTYYKMGRISETEQLYAVAQRYYEQAVPYLDSAAIPLYAACGYRELARTSTDSVLQRKYFEKAQAYAAGLDTLTQLDVRYSALSHLNPQSEELIRISQYLCDSAGQKRYAYDLVRYYLKQNQLTQAKAYLDVLAEDTAALDWSRDKYAFLLSCYLKAYGNNAAAYETLLGLYNKQSGEIEASGMTRTFTISEQFDNAGEREKNLQLRVEKQRLFVVLVSLLAVVLAVGIVLEVLYSRRKAKAMVRQAEAEASIERLSAELQLRRESMQRVLAQRISLSKNLQESIVRHRDEAVPQWAKEFVETNIFTTEEQWASFREEFNACYGDMLTRMKAEHPALTPADLQVIALTVLGVDISDICLLLNLTKRTVWSRRLRIKTHLGLSEEEQLDEWLMNYK